MIINFSAEQTKYIDVEVVPLNNDIKSLLPDFYELHDLSLPLSSA